MWCGHLFCYTDKLQDMLITPDYSDIGYFLEIDLLYPKNIKKKAKNFPFCLESKISPQSEVSDYLKEVKSNIYSTHENLIRDWTDEKIYFFSL